MTTSTLWPVLRSTFRIEEGALRCLLGKVATRALSVAEQAALARADGETTLAELDAAQPGAAALLTRLGADGAVSLLERPEVGHGDLLVVLEPHPDDAVLSAGGQLLARRGRRALHIVTVVGVSNYTSNWELGGDLLPAEVVTEMRAREARAVARALGAGWDSLGVIDAPLRFLPDADWSTPERMARNRPLLDVQMMPTPPTRREIDEVKERLLPALDRLRPTEVWIPLGVGRHRDHVMTERAALELYATDRGRFRLSFYPEVPYLVFHGDEVAGRLAALAAEGFRTSPVVEDVSGLFAAKVALAQLYGSQYEVTDADLLRSACFPPWSLLPGRAAEHRYAVDP